jgi:hypothetical protein
VETYNSILCIPGNWKDWKDFILKIVTASDGEYIAAGNILMNAKANRHFTVTFCEYDYKMKAAFKSAGMVNQVSDNFLEEIDNHKYVIYLTGNAGSFLEAEHIARAGLLILQTGGIGIKVETAGKAFEKYQWEKYFADFEFYCLYEMFVVESIYNNINNLTYSCGMQNIGLRDTIIYNEEFQEAVNLIRIFSFYQIVDNAVLLNNQIFTPLINSNNYRITEEVNQPNEGDDMFANPFGMWRLSKI